MSEHPTPVALRAFLEGRLSGEKRRGIVRHLLSGCLACTAEVSETVRFLQATERGRLPVEPAMEGDPYEAPLRRAFAAVRLHGLRLPEIKRKTARALAQYEKGKRRPSPSQNGSIAVYEAALAHCRALRHDDPRGMMDSALNAVQISWNLAAEGYTPEQVADFKARALGEFANAYRVADILGEADDILRQAFAHALVGTGDTFVALRLKDLKASLLGAQHRYDEAVLITSELVQEYLRLGDRQALARVLVQMANYRGLGGGAEEAVRLLAHAEAMVDEARDPELKLAITHNRLYFLLEVGHPDEAMVLLRQAEDESSDLMGSLDRFKLKGIEGRIFAAQRHWPLAAQALREAREGFSAHKANGHAALIALDLAAVVMRQGRHQEGLLYAAEALQEFTRLNIEDQKAEALLVLAEAITQRLVTATLVQSVADFVRREHKPQDRYEPRFE